MQPNRLSRRAVVVSSASILGVGAAATAFSRDSEAASVGFDLPDSTVSRSEDPSDVRIEVSANIEWDATQAPDGYEVRLLVGPALDTLDLLTYRLEDGDVPASGSETVALAGSLTTTEHFAASDFTLPESGETTHTVAARLVFGLRRASERVLEQTADTTMTLTLAQDGLSGALGLDATGEVIVE